VRPKATLRGSGGAASDAAAAAAALAALVAGSLTRSEQTRMACSRTAADSHAENLRKVAEAPEAASSAVLRPKAKGTRHQTLRVLQSFSVPRLSLSVFTSLSPMYPGPVDIALVPGLYHLGTGLSVPYRSEELLWFRCSTVMMDIHAEIFWKFKLARARVQVATEWWSRLGHQLMSQPASGAYLLS
jgi:hypothetical protein